MGSVPDSSRSSVGPDLADAVYSVSFWAVGAGRAFVSAVDRPVGVCRGQHRGGCGGVALFFPVDPRIGASGLACPYAAGRGVVGALFGLACWKIRPVRRLIEWIGRSLRIPYSVSAWGMILGGALGIWLHVLIDGVYHYDIQQLWPWRYNLVRYWFHFQNDLQIQRWVRGVCLGCLAVAVVLWFRIARRKGRGPEEGTA